ncbi:three component ABC system middle component [Acinetobacter guillouiae]|jgi:hypothetical protein|uniref:three component ABC system middle component n=1 Tax=Acinetobacter TaxID=469 RepID=UPI003AF5B3AB
MKIESYNNIAMCTSSLHLIISKKKSIELSKALLIYPLIMHDETLIFLAKKSTKPRRLNSLISTHPLYFINYNERFINSLPISLNSIQFLLSTKKILFQKNLICNSELKITKQYGKRLSLVEKASDKIIYLLDQPLEELYLNLRVTL